MNRIIYCFLTVVFFLFTSCGKKGVFVPDVYVNYRISVQEFTIKTVNSNGILLVPNEGVAGLMIVKTLNGYMAFDRCSTVNPQNLCKIVPDDSGITATDPCTGAKWLLFDGSPQKAPAVRNLKSYRVNVQGGQLQISN